MSDDAAQVRADSRHRPPMNFRVDDLLDVDTLRHGPMVVYWGQDEYIPANRDTSIEWKRPPHYLRSKLLRCRPFRFNVRIAPPPGADLNEWGVSVAERLSVPWQGPPKDGDKAVWLPGVVMARTASHAVGSIKRVFDRLDGFTVGAVQVEAFEIRAGDRA